MGGYDDVKKMWLQHELILRKLKNYGDIYFQDATNGSNGNHGRDPLSPFKTLEYAIAQLTDSHNDVIIHKGLENVTAGISVDKNKMSIFGWGLFGANPYYPETGSFYRSTAENAPVISIDADFVEIAGMTFVAEWVADNIAYQEALLIAEGSNKAYIHNCLFPDWAYASQTVGIKIEGAHYSVIENCAFHSTYGNIDFGIYVKGGSSSNTAQTIIKGCHFIGGSGVMASGIGQMPGLGTWQWWKIEDCTFLQVTNAILLGTSANLYGTVKGIVGTMAKADIFESSEASDSSISDITSGWKVTAADCWGSDGPLVS